MSAREKMKKAERVPTELLSRFNAARADYLQTVMDADKRVKEFAQKCLEAVNEAKAAAQKEADAIAKAMNFSPTDKFDTSTGLVKRAPVEAAK